MLRSDRLSSVKAPLGASVLVALGLLLLRPASVRAAAPGPVGSEASSSVEGGAGEAGVPPLEPRAEEPQEGADEGQAKPTGTASSSQTSSSSATVSTVSTASNGSTVSESTVSETQGSTSGEGMPADGSRSAERGEPQAAEAPEVEAHQVTPASAREARRERRERRADERHALNVDPGTMLRNRWPFEPVCNLGVAPDLCLTIDAEVFTGYRMRSIAGERFGEFALDRSEFGTNFWYRANRWIDGGVALRLESVRSAGPQSLIGIDGDSLVIRLAQAYGHTAAHLGPISIGVRGGMIPERWIEQVEKGYDTVGVGRLASEQNLLMERADLGGSLTVSGWEGLVEFDLQMTNGEGRAQEELNRGKNTTAMFTVRPLRHRHAKGPITLALHGAYRDGSWGVAAARAHRAAGAFTLASPWGFAGAEFVQAFGVREQGDRVSRSVGGWISAYAWRPYIGLVGKFDHVRQDLDLEGSSVNIVTAGLFSDLFGYTWRRRRRVRLYAAYQPGGHGATAGPIPGAPGAANTHRFLLQIEAAGLIRAL